MDMIVLTPAFANIVSTTLRSALSDILSAASSGTITSFDDAVKNLDSYDDASGEIGSYSWLNDQLDAIAETDQWYNCFKDIFTRPIVDEDTNPVERFTYLLKVCDSRKYSGQLPLSRFNKSQREQPDSIEA